MHCLAITGPLEDAASLLQSCSGIQEHTSNQILWSSLCETNRAKSEEGNVKGIELQFWIERFIQLLNLDGN